LEIQKLLNVCFQLRTTKD